MTRFRMSNEQTAVLLRLRFGFESRRNHDQGNDEPPDSQSSPLIGGRVTSQLVGAGNIRDGSERRPVYAADANSGRQGS